MNGIRFKMPHGMPYYNYGNEEQILTPCAASSCNTSAGMNCECFHHFNLTLNNIVQVLNWNFSFQPRLVTVFPTNCGTQQLTTNNGQHLKNLTSG